MNWKKWMIWGSKHGSPVCGNYRHVTIYHLIGNSNLMHLKKFAQMLWSRNSLPNGKMMFKNDCKYPILRTYRKFQTRYELEPYLYLVKNPKYRIAISKLRSSSHMLEIERGRHTGPVTPLENRLCPTCKVVENEIHFLLDCPSYERFREELFKKIDSVDLYFKQLLPTNKFLYLTSTSNEQILKWSGKFIYLSLNKRTIIAK